ncbi:MAG TPA: DUF4344 domain-containing metallopeptidase [Devosiaceae bacterium]|jgi:hypothetical protein|nr:DUF4344 domain-containing metallopeptidase [Devosiaceae bacterium]
MRRLIACALAVAWLGGAVSAQAQELTEEQQVLATEFAYNNSLFVLYHEIGHLFVGEFGLPVLGKEEDAADSLASVMLLVQDTDESAQALIDAADGWYLTEYSGEADSWESADFYDEHSLSIQRSYQAVCLMVGADPETFGEVADEFEMDSDRQESCAFDYQQALTSWASLLEPYEGSDGAAIEVVYEEPAEDYADIAQFLQDSEFLEGAAAWVTENYALPREVTFRAMQCDEENAYYSYDDAEITFCYELTPYFFSLLEQDMLSAE